MAFYMILPELIVLTMACIILMIDVYIPQKQLGITYFLTQLTLIGAFVMSIILYFSPTAVVFHGNFVRDRLTSVSEIFMYVSMFILFVLSRRYILDRKNMARGEYYVLALFSLLGMMVLVGGHTLLTLFLGLELMALPLYALVAMQRDNGRATEAAMKYFVLGAIASGMLLYGMSMIYGATGSLNIGTIATRVASANHVHQLTLIYGLVFLIAGIAFKFGAAPFHMWVPDVYDGAPTSVTMLVGSAPKIAAFVLAVRLLIQMLSSLHAQWSPLFVFLTLFSIGLGNVLAIAQTNFKRLLAYSGIANMGYMALGFLPGTAQGEAGALFYVITYALSVTAALAILIILSRKGVECEKISDLKGLHQRSPWLALMMLFVMFSMAGVPPFIGFFAKVAVIEALLAAGYVAVPIIAIAFAVVGLYYYLRVVKVMYFDATDNKIPQPVGPLDAKVVVSLNGIALLAFGLFPGLLFTLVHQVFLQAL
jgi:NADH-quinone oxidoreductase subunit N